MRARHLLVSSTLVLLALPLACGSETDSPSTDAGDGDSGGSTNDSGGSSTDSGGSTATGGSSTGGETALGGDSSLGGTPGTGGNAPESAPTCATYCAAITAECTGDDQQYSGEQDCLDHCGNAASFPVGEPGDAGVSTLECRQVALNELLDGGAAGTWCDQAGPTGGNTCGTWCDNYCDLVSNVCTGSDQLYSTRIECMDACASFPDDANVGETSGNSVQCRIFHASIAAVDPALHCPHAGADGGNVCGSWCDSYCDLVGDVCTGGDQLYPSRSDCMTACGGFNTNGSPGDVGGDTVQCRISHAQFAATDAAVHCPHAGQSGGGICVD